MGQIDHLGGGQEMADLVRRIERLERAAPVGFSSIGRGALRVYSAEGLIVEGSARVSGQLIVTGTERVDGTLRVDGHLIVAGDMDITGPTVMSGTFTLDGDTTINGKVVITGDMDITGETFITGKLHIDGDTDVTGDMKVTGGGEITVEGASPMKIGVTGLGLPGVEFASGGGVSSQTGGARLYGSGGSYVGAFSGEAIVGAGSGIVRVGSEGTRVTGNFISALPPKLGAPANVHVDASGKFWRTD